MGRAMSVDLRLRVVEAIDGGLSTREAARRFAIGIATAGAWHRLWRRTGSVAPRRQGHPVRSKLDAHETFIMALVDADKDITLTEIAERLKADRRAIASRALVWYFFDKRGVTFKKRLRTRPSRTGRTSRTSAGPGSRVSSTSTRPA